MSASSTRPQTLEAFKVNTRFKLAALWTSVMFCYIYGDIFSLFVPGRIQRLNDGHSGTGNTTPVTILCYALLMTIPALMVFLSLALKETVSKWLNIIFGIVFTLIMGLILFTSFGEWMLFYSWMAIVEIVLTLIIVCQALKWPKYNA